MWRVDIADWLPDATRISKLLFFDEPYQNRLIRPLAGCRQAYPGRRHRRLDSLRTPRCGHFLAGWQKPAMSNLEPQGLAKFLSKLFFTFWLIKKFDFQL